MILVDMPMPKKCLDCPISYWIQSGKCEGMLMCCAMEARENAKMREDAAEFDVSDYLVDELAEIRDSRCPIKGEVLKGVKRQQGKSVKWDA